MTGDSPYFWRFGALLAVVGPCVSLGCSTCDRDGCDATQKVAAETGRSGVGGVVASRSDVIENDCQSCPFASARIEFRPTDAALTDPAEVSAFLASTSPTVVNANGHYALPLDPGSYLACADRYCVNIEVYKDRTTTLNIKLIYGPTQFTTADVTDPVLHDVPEIAVVTT